MAQKQRDFVAVDDSGDAGLKDGSSSYFSVAAVVFNDTLEAESASLGIKRFKRSLGWPDAREFKFNKMNRELRMRFIEMVVPFDFGLHALCVDKSHIDPVKVPSDWDSVYDQVILELLHGIPMQNAIVRIDGRYGKKYMRQMEGYYRRELNKTEHKADNVRFVDSRDSVLIQLADIAVGSVGRSLQTAKTDSQDYIGLLRGKVESIEEFRVH
jgi:hypothetical protein